MFAAYKQEGLASTLRPGDIVVMDNFSAQKFQDIRDTIRERQAEASFLSASGPGLNPIEKIGAKLNKY